MGSITKRKRKDGSIGYTAQVQLQKEGKSFSQAQTFDRESAAKIWITKKKKSSPPGACLGCERL